MTTTSDKRKRVEGLEHHDSILQFEAGAEALEAAAAYMERLDEIAQTPMAQSNHDDSMLLAASPLFDPARRLERSDYARWLRGRAADLRKATS